MNRPFVIAGVAVGCIGFASFSLFADTVTIDPGNGVSSNVEQRITGAADVVVNSGASGGGIATLNPHNTYTGSTTIGCGTLVATALGGSDGSSIGLTSGLIIGPGTLRYSGPVGGVLSAPVASSFTSASTKSCVLDVQSDLVVDGNWTQNYGSFIKTGPGTVTFRGNKNFFGAVDTSTTTATSNGNTERLAFNANGDAPTAGVRGGFVLAEGKMVIEGDESTTNYFNSSTARGAIGTWTAEDGEQEKSAVLEVRGGYNMMWTAGGLAYHNGTAATGGENVSSGIRVTGGYLGVGDPSAKKETIFVGGTTSPNGTQRSNPFIEVSGGTLEIARNLQLANQEGVNTRIDVSGDGKLVLGQYMGIGYQDGAGPSTNSVTVSGNGTLETCYIEMRKKAGASQCDVSLLDDSTFVWTVTNNPAFKKESGATGVMNILIDGGTVSNSVKATSALEINIFGADIDRVAIGTRGATFTSSDTSTAQFRYGLKVPFATSNTVAGAEQEPVSFLSGNSKKTTYRFYSAFNWPGSLYLGPFAYIYVQSGATFATDGTFIHCRDARLLSNVDSLTFKNYQIGEEGVADGVATVFLTAGTHITVTNEFKVASSTGLYVYMRADGAAWTAGGTTFTTVGDYLVLTVPESSRSELERLPTSYAYASSCSSHFYIRDNCDGTVSLVLRIESSSTGTTTTVTDFVDGAELDSGTLEYAGAGETTSGFSINAAGAAVLKTTGALAVTEGVETKSGALIKTGAGDLTLAGSGTYSFAGGDVNWSSTSSKNEVGENGESPSAGYRGLSIREGKVIVGAQPDDAPTVEVSSLSVGSNPAATDTPGELIISNGTVDVAAEARISPADGKVNRIEVSGGTLLLRDTLCPGDMTGMDDESYEPGQIVVNDGGRLSFGSGTGSTSRLYQDDTGELELTINEGGVVSAYSNLIGDKTTTPYRGTLKFNGGVYSFATPSLAPYLRYVNIVVGAKGAVFDGEERFANGGVPTAGYLHIGGTWTKDSSLGDDPDGGIVFRGRALFYLGGTFSATIEGPVVVQDRAQLETLAGAAENLRVTVKPGAGIRSYQNSQQTSRFTDLVLGEEGSAVPARMEIRNNSESKSIYSMVVTNDFATLSPVCFSARTYYNNSSVSIGTGVYTAVVYRAECDADVDVSKFYLDPEKSDRTAVFAKVDIDGGDYDGYKAILVTVSGGTNAAEDTAWYPQWTATSSGGSWSTPSNWADGTMPGASGSAVFNAPAAANVPVSVDTAASLEKMVIGGTDSGKGYAFGGAVPLEIAGDVFATAHVTIAGGTHAFSAPLCVSRDAVMDSAAGSTVTIASKTGDGTLAFNAASETTTGKTVVEGVAAGGIAAGFGRTEVQDLSFASESGKLTLGSGTLAYTGGTAAKDVHLSVSPNRTDVSVSATVFENDSDVGVTEIVPYDNVAFIKTGSGTMSLDGSGTFTFKGTMSWANSDDDLISDAGNAPIRCLRGLNVAEGEFVAGVAGDDDNAPTIASDNISVGLRCSTSGSSASLVLNNGTLGISDFLILGNFMTSPSAAFSVKYIQNGGTASSDNVYLGYAGSGATAQAAAAEFTLNGGEYSIPGTLYASHARRKYAGIENVVTVNGGVLSANDVIGVSYAQENGNPAPSTIVVNGGEFNVSRNYTFAYRQNETHTLELNGGVFSIGGYMLATNSPVDGVSATIKLNGGEFRPLTAAPSIDDAIAALVGEGGAVISTEKTSGGTCTLSMALQHDAALGDAVDGGLVKRGAGTLVLTGENTYTGPTVVEEGTLKASALPGGVEVAYGATLDVDGGTISVSSLAGTGTIDGSVVVTGAFAASDFDSIPYITGSLSTVGKATVDTGDVIPEFGTFYALAEVEGDINVTLGKPSSSSQYTFVPVRIGNILYARVSHPLGTAILFR